ncbi:MAG TPA: hypothetical protein VE867_03050 [Candidatus Binatia bacterium]|nr:hypothetical protein [Candidatus Binatia bacterium]
MSQLLKDLCVKFRVDVEQQSEERLREWTAWDPTAKNPREGRELWIRTRDLDTVGSKIVEMFPDRKFGAA